MELRVLFWAVPPSPILFRRTGCTLAGGRSNEAPENIQNRSGFIHIQGFLPNVEVLEKKERIGGDREGPAEAGGTGGGDGVGGGGLGVGMGVELVVVLSGCSCWFAGRGGRR